MTRARTLVIGLDCVPPQLVFERYRDAMPHLTHLAQGGSYGRLRSTDPPITVPAWQSMVTGRDPGELGLYGFRARHRGSRQLALVSSRDLREKRVWDRLGEAGQKVAALFVPLTSPPKPVNGLEVSGFLWPGGDAPFCWPPGAQSELVDAAGDYRADVARFGEQSNEALLAELSAMVDQHFALAEYVLRSREPDFLMMVEIGTDRLHHALWEHMDHTHPRHDPSSPLVAACRDYYARIDRRIGALVVAAGADARVMMVSDHGAQPMRGGVRLNEWLRREGWLVTRSTPAEGTRLMDADVDWSTTRAWAEGGYYARVFLNLRGEHADGCVDAADAEATLSELKRALEEMPGADGDVGFAAVTRPEELYRAVRGYPPDLMVTFGELGHRALGELGGEVFTPHDARGRDSANHAKDGFFLLHGADLPARGEVAGAHILDVAPTLLGLAGLEVPSSMRGRDWSRP